MSLRNRLLLAIAAALLASFLAGTWVTAWQATRLVHAELSSAMETGRQGVLADLQDIGGSATPAAQARMVASFDASRHVLAELHAGGAAIAHSHPATPAVAVPAWFASMASPALQPIDIALGGTAVLRLSPLPAAEIGERWSEARRLVALLGLFSVLAATSCFLTTAWSVRPLRALAGALAHLEHGRPSGTLLESGPPEVAMLSSAFNRMQQALRTASHENRRLSSQLGRLAEEERAELARDLHDEIGPLLFGVTALAAAARMQQSAGDGPAAGQSLQALENAAADLQGSVRDLLRRLRDSAPGATDLAMSLEELVAFWRGIRPQTEFRLNVEPAAEAAPEPAKAALFRVAQEGVSNAIRHGNPACVQIEVAPSGNGVSLSVRDDGSGGVQGDGYGLIGMEERLQALGGTLEVSRDKGWRLTAWAPAEPAAAA